jgi:hypothetical protein
MELPGTLNDPMASHVAPSFPHTLAVYPMGIHRAAYSAVMNDLLISNPPKYTTPAVSYLSTTYTHEHMRERVVA